MGKEYTKDIAEWRNKMREVLWREEEEEWKGVGTNGRTNY
jgi:hypothetical protein